MIICLLLKVGIVLFVIGHLNSRIKGFFMSITIMLPATFEVFSVTTTTPL